MVELLTEPPPPEVVARMTAVPGVHVETTTLATQQGPDGHLGPEAAGSLLLLQGTFADETGARGFLLEAAELAERLATTPGFIRRFSFRDGPHHTLIVLWRTVADANAFFASNEHRAAMQHLHQNRWLYSHFAGLWEVVTPRDRVIFCQRCDGVTPVSERRCQGCGDELFDPFSAPDRVER